VDLFLVRFPRALQGPGRSAVRTIRLHDGVRLRYRLNRGDLQSFREVWLGETYRLPATLASVETIVDLGANIGLTSVYLAQSYGARRVIAVEPVPSNAALLRQNLDLNNVSGDVIEAVIGPVDGVARFQDASHSNLGHVADHGRDVRSLSMNTVLAQLGMAEIDILKVDIEGAEHGLLTGDRSWLQHVRSLMIEFHPPFVDSKRLAAVIESEGFRHIPAGSVHAHSTSTFIRVAGKGPS
jgi:FkbM family methyltransferase